MSRERGAEGDGPGKPQANGTTTLNREARLRFRASSSTAKKEGWLAFFGRPFGYRTKRG